MKLQTSLHREVEYDSQDIEKQILDVSAVSHRKQFFLSSKRVQRQHMQRHSFVLITIYTGASSPDHKSYHPNHLHHYRSSTPFPRLHATPLQCWRWQSTASTLFTSCDTEQDLSTCPQQLMQAFISISTLLFANVYVPHLSQIRISHLTNLESAASADDATISTTNFWQLYISTSKHTCACRICVILTAYARQEE